MSVHHFDDLDYTVIAEPDGEYICDFRVYYIAGRSEVGELLYGPTYEPDVSKGRLFLNGHIKWDGCSNWSFYDNDGTRLHFCSGKEAASIGILFSRLYELAAKIIPAWSGA